MSLDNHGTQYGLSQHNILREKGLAIYFGDSQF